MSILIKNGNILQFDNYSENIFCGDIFVEGNKIVKIADHITSEGAEKIIDASNYLVMPGLNIAHAHSWAQLLKGVIEGAPLEIWILENIAPPKGWSFSPRQIYLRTILGAAEMIRSGATSVWDELLLTVDQQDHIFNAYKDIGMRATVTAAMYDKRHHERTVFLDEILPEPLLLPLSQEKIIRPDEWMDIAEQIISKWHGCDERLNFAVSVNWAQGGSEELIVGSFELAHKYNLPFVTHGLESKIQQVTGKVYYDRTIIRWLFDLGVIKPRTSIVHGIWVTDDDIKLLADGQASVLHNPCCNLILGSGIMPYRKFKDAGVNIAIGVDEGYQVRWNPFEMMRMTAMMHKVSTPDHRQWPDSREILMDATYGGARSELIQHEVWSLKEGMKADLILIDMQSFSMNTPAGVIRQLVYSEMGDSVNTSIINGQVVMENRELLTININAIFEEINETMSDYFAVQEKHGTLALSKQLRPYVESIYRRVIETPTGLNRWIGNEVEWIKR